jgi:hypothetical protein
MNTRRPTRNQKGAHLAELGAALMFGLPLLVLIVYVALETTHFYTIKSAMDVGARNAARALVVDYNKTNTKGTSVTWLTMPHYIASSKQFSIDWDTANPPTFVTVTCSYPNDGSYGLPQFPGGPLRWLFNKSANNSTFTLGTMTVQGTFTVPIQ